MDMQKVDMLIKWNDAFVEGEMSLKWNNAFVEGTPEKIKAETIEMQFDEEVSNAKGK